MANLKTLIEVQFDGATEFLQTTEAAKQELLQIEKALTKKGFKGNEKELKAAAKNYKKSMENSIKQVEKLDKARIRNTEKQERKAQARRERRLKKLRKLGARIVIGGTVITVIGKVVGKIFEVFEKFEGTETSIGRVGEAFSNVATIVENVIIASVNFLEPVLTMVAGLINSAAGLLGLSSPAASQIATSQTQTTKALQEAEKVYEELVKKAERANIAAEKDVALAEESLKIATDRNTAAADLLKTITLERAVIQDTNIDLEARKNLYRSLQDRNKDIFQTSLDQIKSEEDLQTAYREGVVLLRQKRDAATSERNVADLRLKIAKRLNELDRASNEAQRSFILQQIQSLRTRLSAMSAMSVQQNADLDAAKAAVEAERARLKLTKQETLELERQATLRQIKDLRGDRKDAIGRGDFQEAARLDALIAPLVEKFEELGITITTALNPEVGSIISQMSGLNSEMKTNREELKKLQAEYDNFQSTFRATGVDFSGIGLTATSQGPLITSAIQSGLKSGSFQTVLDEIAKSALSNVSLNQANLKSVFDKLLTQYKQYEKDKQADLDAIAEEANKKRSEINLKQAKLDALQTKLDAELTKKARTKSEVEINAKVLNLVEETNTQIEALDQDSLDKRLAQQKVYLNELKQFRKAEVDNYQLLLRTSSAGLSDILGSDFAKLNTSLDETKKNILKTIDSINKSEGIGNLIVSTTTDDAGNLFLQEAITTAEFDALPIKVRQSYEQLLSVVENYNLQRKAAQREIELADKRLADDIIATEKQIARFENRKINVETRMLTTELSDEINDFLRMVSKEFDKELEDIDTIGINVGFENQKKTAEAITKAALSQLERTDGAALAMARLTPGADTTVQELEYQEKRNKLLAEGEKRLKKITDAQEAFNSTFDKNSREQQIEFLDNLAEIASQSLVAIGRVGQSIADLNATIMERMVSDLEENIANIDQQISDTTSKINEMESDLEGKRSGRRDALLRGIETEKENEKSLIDYKIAEEKKLADIQRQQARERKSWAIAQATLEFAVASIATWRNYMQSTGPAPVSAILAGIQQVALGAVYGTQIATINAQQFADGGMLEGPSHSNGGIPFTIGGNAGFEAEGGEYIINKRAVKKHRPLIEAINNDGKFANGGLLNGRPNFRGMSSALGKDSRTLERIANQSQYVNVTDIQNVMGKRVRVANRTSI